MNKLGGFSSVVAVFVALFCCTESFGHPWVGGGHFSCFQESRFVVKSEAGSSILIDGPLGQFSIESVTSFESKGDFVVAETLKGTLVILNAGFGLTQEPSSPVAVCGKFVVLEKSPGNFVIHNTNFGIAVETGASLLAIADHFVVFRTLAGRTVTYDSDLGRTEN